MKPHAKMYNIQTGSAESILPQEFRAISSLRSDVVVYTAFTNS